MFLCFSNKAKCFYYICTSYYFVCYLLTLCQQGMLRTDGSVVLYLFTIILFNDIFDDDFYSLCFLSIRVFCVSLQ